MIKEVNTIKKIGNINDQCVKILVNKDTLYVPNDQIYLSRYRQQFIHFLKYSLAEYYQLTPIFQTQIYIADLS